MEKPADLYLEGSDQHRGWFQSSLLTGCAIDGLAPYKNLLTHGFVVDGNGRKMSKSVGNVIAPQKISDTLGADVLRLWVAATDYSAELTISDEILKRVVESYRRIRNTLRFLLANLSDFDPNVDGIKPTDWLEVDRYAVQMSQRLQRNIEKDYEEYEFHYVVQKFQAFCSEDLGGFYLDILKDRLYTSGERSRERRSAQNAMWHITHSLLRLMAPVLSFTADEAWSTFVNDEKMQESSTGDMIFDVPTLISFLSGSTTLLPGTLILTGTPSGVWEARDPKRFLVPGDEVSVEIEGIGVLTNPVMEETFDDDESDVQSEN